jgi:hypothetical protein
MARTLKPDQQKGRNAGFEPTAEQRDVIGRPTPGDSLSAAARGNQYFL